MHQSLTKIQCRRIKYCTDYTSATMDDTAKRRTGRPKNVNTKKEDLPLKTQLGILRYFSEHNPDYYLFADFARNKKELYGASKGNAKEQELRKKVNNSLNYLRNRITEDQLIKILIKKGFNSLYSKPIVATPEENPGLGNKTGDTINQETVINNSQAGFRKYRLNISAILNLSDVVSQTLILHNTLKRSPLQ